MVKKTTGEPAGTTEDSDPVEDLEYLAKRILEERAKAEHTITEFGRLEEGIEIQLEGLHFAQSIGVDPDESRWPGVITAPALGRARFDRYFPPNRDPDPTLAFLDAANSTSGSAIYSMVTGSHSFVEVPSEMDEYQRITGRFQKYWENPQRFQEVVRRLGWISEEAANRIKAAREAILMGVPATDPTTGPALQLRSAIELTVRALLDRIPEEKPPVKLDYFEHIAKHLTTDQDAAQLLSSQGETYVNLTRRLTAAKGSSSLDRQHLRTLFHKSQELLFTLLTAIDAGKLLPRNN